MEVRTVIAAALAFAGGGRRGILAIGEAARRRGRGRDAQGGPQTGVQLREFEAASLRINDVIASGTGVVAEKTKIAGHAEITGIRAGVTEDQNPKRP